jgi:acyl phosphate:glycerol-3-phosphate acyltransferase
LLEFVPMTLAVFAVCAILSYVLGSIPTGYLMAKARGIDIRTVGSGNIGATNVFRALGKVAGAITLILDCAKGAVAVLAVPSVVARLVGMETIGGTPIVCALAVILGHNYTCWLKFKGGKGIATSAGALLGLAPMAVLLCVIVWVVVFGIGRYVSLASIAAAVALPVAVYCTERLGRKAAPDGSRWVILSLAVALCMLALWRHRSNIHRLITGTEHRFTRKPKPDEGTV